MTARRYNVTTAADIILLPVTGQSYRAWDTRQPGLCVRVSAQGAKTWSYKYRVNGKQQTFAIAPADPSDPQALTPGQARKKAKLLGADPAGEKRQAQAEQKAKQVAAERAATRTIRALLDDEGAYWKDELCRKRDGEGTRKRIQAAWSSLLDRDLSTLAETDLERVRRARLRAGNKPQSINRDWSALRALLNFAKRRKLIDDFPHLKALEQHDDKKVRYLGQHDPGERVRFLAALDVPETEPYLRTLILIAYWTGARRGEVFGLRWREIDFRRDMITLRAHTSKSAKTRHVPLHVELKKVLLQWQEEQGQSDPSALVVPSPTSPSKVRRGNQLTTVKKSWKSFIDRARITDFTYHCLRHDFASRLVMKGVDLYKVRDLLGHSTIQLTERYAHLAPEDLQQAVAVL